MSNNDPEPMTLMAIFAKETPCSLITPPDEWGVLAHVLRHYTFCGPHTNPTDYYNEECIRWLEHTWRKELANEWQSYPCKNHGDDNCVMIVAQHLIDAFYNDWDTGGWREWSPPTWATIIVGLRDALEKRDANAARQWLDEGEVSSVEYMSQLEADIAQFEDEAVTLSGEQELEVVAETEQFYREMRVDVGGKGAP
jgi:hypothetical protein